MCGPLAKKEPVQYVYHSFQQRVKSFARIVFKRTALNKVHNRTHRLLVRYRRTFTNQQVYHTANVQLSFRSLQAQDDTEATLSPSLLKRSNSSRCAFPKLSKTFLAKELFDIFVEVLNSVRELSFTLTGVVGSFCPNTFMYANANTAIKPLFFSTMYVWYRKAGAFVTPHQNMLLALGVGSTAYSPSDTSSILKSFSRNSFSPFVFSTNGCELRHVRSVRSSSQSNSRLLALQKYIK